MHVLGPDAGAEAHFGVVGAGDDVGFGGPFEDGEDGAEGLFGYDAGGFGGGVEEGGGDEVAGWGGGGEGAAAGFSWSLAVVVSEFLNSRMVRCCGQVVTLQKGCNRSHKTGGVIRRGDAYMTGFQPSLGISSKNVLTLSYCISFCTGPIKASGSVKPLPDFSVRVWAARARRNWS